MIIIKDNIWRFRSKNTPIVITTNGTVKKNGEAVMGRGIALQCKTKFPEFPLVLGKELEYIGNEVIYFPGCDLITFPVKHNWWEDADLVLIRRSAIQLEKLLRDFPYIEKIYMTKPGCSNGKRDWETEVKPILMDYYEDNDKLIICDLN